MAKKILGRDVIDFLSAENTLLDSQLVDFSVSNYFSNPILDLKFSARKNAGYAIAHLRFSDVLEFDFFYQKNYPFFVVEDIKFFFDESGFYYLSLQPDEKIGVKSDEDGNYIKSNVVELILIF